MAIPHNRRVRQEELRKQLSAKCRVEHLLNLIEKIENEPVEQEELERYKVVIQTRLKLISKYLPDLRSVEMSGEMTHNYMMRSPQPAPTVDDWVEECKQQKTIQ